MGTGAPCDPNPPAGGATSQEAGGNIDRLLALIEKYRAEPGDYDERASAVIDPMIAERRLELGEGVVTGDRHARARASSLARS